MSTTTRDTMKFIAHSIKDDEDDNDNSNVIIMKFNSKFLTFDKQTYPIKLHNKIQRDKWEQIALEATRSIGSAWVKKKNDDKIQIPKWMNISSCVSLLFGFIYFVCLFIYVDKDIYTLFIIGIVCMSISLLFMFVLGVYNFIRRYHNEQPLRTYILKGIHSYISELNRKYSGVAVFNIDKDNLNLECKLLV